MQRMIAVAASAALSVLALSTSATAATPYAKQAPRYDKVMLLRVAQWTQFMEGTSAGYCARAGLGVIDHVQRDHSAWYRSKQAKKFKRTVKRSRGKNSYRRACNWLNSQAAQMIVPGLTTVWYEAKRSGYFARLRKALAQLQCRAISESISMAPGGRLVIRVAKRVISRLTASRC